MTTITTEQRTVNELALIKQQIADLVETEQALKADLIATAMSSGEKTVTFTGTLHNVTVSLTDPKPKVDWQAVAKKLEPSPQLLTAYTTPGTSSYVVRVYGRKADKE